jgi:hyperosmotically inducible periplasmic protein
MRNGKLTHGLLALALVFAIGIGVGCSSKRNNKSVKANVENSIQQAGVKDVSVAEDRDKMVVTLTGNVPEESQKTQAEQAATAAAPGWVIANEIGVRPAGAEGDAKSISSNVDDAIEKNYKAALVANNLDNAGIHAEAKNGVLTLNGKVANPQQRDEAQKLAASVPNVGQVVNKLEVKNQPATMSHK